MQLLTVLQNISQASDRWGRDRAETIIANHRARALLPRDRRPRDPRLPPHTLGEEEITRVSTHRQGASPAGLTDHQQRVPRARDPQPRPPTDPDTALLIYGRLAARMAACAPGTRTASCAPSCKAASRSSDTPPAAQSIRLRRRSFAPRLTRLIGAAAAAACRGNESVNTNDHSRRNHMNSYQRSPAASTATPSCARCPTAPPPASSASPSGPRTRRGRGRLYQRDLLRPRRRGRRDASSQRAGSSPSPDACSTTTGRPRTAPSAATGRSSATSSSSPPPAKTTHSPDHHHRGYRRRGRAASRRSGLTPHPRGRGARLSLPSRAPLPLTRNRRPVAGQTRRKPPRARPTVKPSQQQADW